MKNEFKDMTIEDMKNAEVGTVVCMGCRECEGIEEHQKMDSGKWKCLWCKTARIEF